MIPTTQNRQPADVPVGGQFATTVRTEPTALTLTADDPVDLACDECGNDMVIEASGVSHHLDADGDVDHDADAEHVAFTTQELPARTPVHEELADLVEQVGYEHTLAREAHQDSIDVAWTAASYGTAAERRTYNARHDEAKAELEVAARRHKAVMIAADPATHRPDPETFQIPTSLTALRRTLKDAKAGKVRGLVLTNAATAKLEGRLEVAGPADGTPLFVDVASGFAPLRVTGGVVVVNAHSAMGNGIDVGKDATVVVFAGSGRKVSTSVDGGVACVVGAEGTRGLQFSRGGVLDVVAKTDTMTVSEATR